MEVHHHTHTARKSFRHYSFEFFMLFFAVFCGFLAEYFLEHRIERHREHQFIESMVMDLKEDTAQIAKVYRENKIQIAQLDTLIGFMALPAVPSDSMQRLYRVYLNGSMHYENVVFADRTITQLKNSGGLRLILNQKVSDSIMAYDAGVRGCNLQFDVVREAWKTQSDQSFGLFDLAQYFTNKKSGGKGPLTAITNDAVLRKAYTNHLFIFSGTLQNYAQVIEQQKVLATRLIAFLKKEYDLD